jgi:hypothetical protein
VTRIFASGVFGSDYDLWGAWSFTDRRTRDKLARTIGDDDWCLAIGMTSTYTPERERGRLLALLKIGPELIGTREMVEPEHWRRSVEEHGVGKWEHGFPIRSVERFVPTGDGLPTRREVLPRVDAENRYMQVGRYFLELMPEEVARVLALPRTVDPSIYQSATSAFSSRLRRGFTGPPPTNGTRLLTTTSGPAATYLALLTGSAATPVAQPVLAGPRDLVWKIGFSNAPDRRLAELNAHLPCAGSLRWELTRTQWHEDEINAWAMEQRIFELGSLRGANRFKGEMIAANRDLIDALWADARASAVRPSQPVEVVRL